MSKMAMYQWIGSATAVFGLVLGCAAQQPRPEHSAAATETAPEVESFARMANVSEDILRAIGNTRAWVKNYAVVVALTKNPKTPLAMSLTLMARLRDRDLATLSVDRNVPDPLRAAARRRVTDATSRK